MPTGYTADVQDGTITSFAEFAKRCARNFGALVTLRDEAMDAELPTELQPHTSYYDEQLENARQTLTDMSGWTDEQWTRTMRQDNATALASWTSAMERKSVEQIRYETMAAKVEAWTPPTPEHERMKQFMLDQLSESIKFDCSPWPAPKPHTDLASYKADRLGKLARDVDYHTQQRREEIERTTQRNAWLSALLASLPTDDELVGA